MSERFALEATTRDVVGKKVKQIRAQGQVPAVVYGPLQDPMNIALEWKTLRPILINAGGTSLIDINIDGKEQVTTLIRDVQRDPVRRNDVLHIDFYAVNLKETTVASIPVEMLNERDTSNRLTARIVLDYTQIDVEALPTDLPSVIEIDVAKLQEVGDSLYVDALPELEGVTYLIDPEIAIVRSVHIAQPEEEEEGEGEEILGEGSAEPEVIARGKEEDEE